MPRWNNPNCGFQKGHRCSEETRRKIGEANRGRVICGKVEFL